VLLAILDTKVIQDILDILAQMVLPVLLVQPDLKEIKAFKEQHQQQ
jgi:hypothetical protein